MSLAGVDGSPNSTSGAMYAGVPNTVTVPASTIVSGVSSMCRVNSSAASDAVAARLRPTSSRRATPKSTTLTAPRARYVLGLDVAMEDAGLVRGRHRRGDLRADRASSVRLVRGRPLVQRLAGEVLHRDEVLALVLADLVDRDDAGMAQRREHLRLVAQPSQRLLVEQLDCDVALERRVVCEIDVAHAAVAELALDLVLPIDDTRLDCMLHR